MESLQTLQKFATSRRLLPFLAILPLAVFAGAAALLWQQHHARLVGRTALVSSEVAQGFKNALAQQAWGLAMTAQPIAMDTRVREALSANDTERLLADWQGLFETLHREHSLTHFYFFDTNRVCLLRVHKPEKRGDTIERFTAREAERTRKPAWGIELGPLGTFTLRMVQPVFDSERLVGYIELGKEIEDILKGLHTQTGLHVAVSIKKEAIQRETREAGMRMLGREADWQRLPHSVVIYASQGHPSDVLARLADHRPLEASHAHGATAQELADGGRDWRVTVFPLADASGREVGDLLVMNDITAIKTAFSHDITLGGAVGAVILAALLGLTFAMLRRTDAYNHSQQTALRESEARMRAITDSAKDAILMMDPEGRVSFWNPAATKIFGYTPNEALGMNLHQLIAPQRYHADHNAAFSKFKLTGQGAAIDATLDLEACHKNGHEIAVGLSLSALYVEGGWHTVGIVHDITERKEAEDALRESEWFVRSLLQSLPLPVYCKDIHGRYQGVNPAFERFFGLPEAGLIGKTVFDISPAELARIYHEKDNELYNLPGRQVYESQVRNSSGELRSVVFHKASLTDSSGTVTGLIGALLDITERKQAEKDLSLAHERILTILDGIDVSVYVADMDTYEILFMNQRMAKEFGGNKTGDLCYTTFRKNSEPCDLCTNDQLIDNNRNPAGVCIWHDKNPVTGRYCINHDRAIEWTDGRLVRMQSSTDITDLKKMEAQLHLAQKLEAIGTLAAGIAHEINTPTQYVGSNIDFLGDAFNDIGQLIEHIDRLLATGDTPERLTSFAAKIEELKRLADWEYLAEEIPHTISQSKQGVAKIGSIVLAMKEFSHPGGKEKQLTDLNRLINTTLTVAGNEWKYVAEIDQSLDPGLPQVLCLPNEMGQVILNILVNAAHAIADKIGNGMAEGKGRITLKTRMVGQQIEITIADTGGGIPKAIAPKIFDPFFTTKEVGRGTGQGLAICHDIIVHKHGGTIDFVSKEGEGTTFIICLPTTLARTDP
jgi:two-component system, NtrC family, sensor kinase